MNYVFVKKYNPSYDFFLTDYFKRWGIDFDEMTSFKKAGQIADEFRKKGESQDPLKPSQAFRFQKYLAAHEALFWTYEYRWGNHPDCRPAAYNLLDKILGGTGVPDVGKMRQLESQLPPGRGKLVFSREEVAKVISDFYKNHLRQPLKTDIERGGVGQELTRYFSSDEFSKVPRINAVGVEKAEEAVNRTATELLCWSEKITQETVLSDIDRVLEEHENLPPTHLREFTSTPSGPPRRLKACEHLSETVTLRRYHDLDTNVVSETLAPSRGYGITDRTMEEGLDEVVFPRYFVIEA